MSRRFWSMMIACSACLIMSIDSAEAGTISASSCSFGDVKAALDKAVNGDTVLVPAGTCTWTQSMDFDLVITNGTNKYLTLQGAGVDRTIIIDGVSKALYPNIPYMLRWTTVNGGLSRITGFTFQGGSLSDPYNQGMFHFRGVSQQLRFDHNKVIPTKTSGLFFYGSITGVVDHNYFNVSAGPYAVYTFHNSWKGVGDYGDNSWYRPNTLGTQEAIFLEDNTFVNNQSGSFHRYAVDGWGGGRVVLRNNTFTACTAGNHGTESGGRWRSQRQFEVYNNKWTWDMKGQGFASLVTTRGGVGVVYNNTATITNGAINKFFDARYFRATGSFAPWGQCPSAWDLNSTTCLDQTGRGAGTLISGFTPTPVQWLNQASDPTYAWNNTVNGVVSAPGSNSINIVIGKDLIHGSRPGYAPFQYPHPLTTGGGGTTTSPAAPKNLQVS